MKHISMMSAFFLIFLISVVSTGCAGKGTLSNPNPPALQNDDMNTPGVSQSPGEDEVIEQISFDDDTDFADFEDEIEEEALEVADPLFHYNKVMYHFNDKLYFWLLKPAARGYNWAVPEPARRGIDNFFYNLRFPIRLVGCLLQAKGRGALEECGRFGINTTVGVLGFGNPAKKYPSLNPSKEDIGQAFGKWGIGNGFYFIWPFIGPSTLRDSVADIGHFFLDPVSYVDPPPLKGPRYDLAIKAYDRFNRVSLRIGDYEALKEAAIDPYIAIRDAYIQNRQKAIEE